jgi:hypothetical protein
MCCVVGNETCYRPYLKTTFGRIAATFTDTGTGGSQYRYCHVSYETRHTLKKSLRKIFNAHRLLR